MEKLGSLSHLFVTVYLSSFASFMVIPAITDVTMFALCPGQDECSLAIYLTGFQQAIIGVGTMVMMPLIGNLSDEYGRKALLTLPLTASIIPLDDRDHDTSDEHQANPSKGSNPIFPHSFLWLNDAEIPDSKSSNIRDKKILKRFLKEVILAYSRATNFFYAYYVLRTLTAMVSEGSINCLALAYVADNISERQRASAFGILSGVVSAAFVCGTLAARFLSTARTFQVAAFVSMLAAAYMRIFLKDSVCNSTGDDDDAATQPILKQEPDHTLLSDGESSQKIQVFKKIPSVEDLISLLRSSKTFSQAAVVSFFNSLAESGIQASLLYFLKARFHFNKDQFADLMLIAGGAGTVSQLLFMPMLAPVIGEEILLSIGLLVGCTHMFLYSIAWSVWVPYVSSMFAVVVVFALPSLRSIVSKQVGPSDQGKAQGCISGISSFGSIISPLIFSPLTALFLSEGAPFHFPGFSIMCIGLVSMIAFIQSIMIRPVPPVTSHKVSNNDCLEA